MKAKIANLRNRIKYGRISEAVTWRLGSAGLVFIPYVWYEESIKLISFKDTPKFDNNFEFTFFGLTEMLIIGQSGAWHYDQQQLLGWLEQNKICYGAKKDGRIAAFTWADLEECKCNYRHFKLKSNEAYLFDMFTMKPFRGQNLAPILRYKTYEALNAMGRDKCYSYSDYFNTPARKFKAKLNAKPVELCLYINLFNTIRKNILIKKL